MKALVRRVLIVGLVGYFAIPWQANADGSAPAAYVTMAPGYGPAFHPVCVSGSFYACWNEPYGTRFCGCWLGGDHPACPSGYFFTCPQAPNGPRACGCY
jgi:hypothetical protein